jgi:hypothetical protein
LIRRRPAFGAGTTLRPSETGLRREGDAPRLFPYMLILRPSAFAGVRLARLAPPSFGAEGSPIERALQGEERRCRR